LALEGGKRTYLEFFCCELLETLIKKRAAFIAKKQQVRGTDKWFEGLFSLWDMREKVLRNPDNTGGLHPYMVGGSDDPGLCKAPYIAAKNVHFPDLGEIAAVEYYIERFLWGGLQREDTEEPFPYAIYGCDNWYELRRSDIGYGSGGLGKERMWRTFDYTHIIGLYHNMYRVAKFYPDMTKYLDKDGYLDRAFKTARAFFTVPYSIKMGDMWSFHGWCDWAYTQGNFHELYIPMLIDDLYAEGRRKEADWLKGEWEKKAKFFVYDSPFPFGSEMKFDTTAFESTHAIAKWGLEHDLRADQNLWQDKNSGRWYSHPAVRKQDFRGFMERETAANIAARGWVEPSYWQLGSDFRQFGCSNYMLSYMTQMGGWSILDYALYYARQPEKYMRLGYASFLGSWALMNTGDAKSNYGFWYPGKENDGATAWAFEPMKVASAWGGGPMTRGAWRYDGEIDSGYQGAIRSAACVLVNDPIFGLVAYGGDIKVSGGTITVIPKDGLRQRFHMLNVYPKLHMEVDRDGFVSIKATTSRGRLTGLSFVLENRWKKPHETELSISGLPSGSYRVAVGKVRSVVKVGAGKRVSLRLPIGAGPMYDVAIRMSGRF